MKLAPGETLSDGRYRLESLLGTGGMASVWLARDDRLNRAVAIKVISDSLAVDDAYVTRFEREARVAAGLSHHNLVRVFDYDAESDRPLLITEYVDGGTLAERLKDDHRQALDLERLALDLLAALDHIHGAGIVHRDVKPANVLFAEDGRALLTDFGIAHPEDATRLTQTGQVIGTLRYLAPEVAEGRPATPQSDLFSCGVLLREAAGGQVPSRLSGLVERLSAAEPISRPVSAAQARASIETLAQTKALRRPASPGEPVDETAPTRRLETPAAPTRKLEIRVAPRTVLLLAAIVASLILVGVIASGGDEGETPSAPLGAGPAPNDAPLDQQLNALERAVRAAGPGAE